MRTQADRDDERGAPVDSDEPRVPPCVGGSAAAQRGQLIPETRAVLPRQPLRVPASRHGNQLEPTQIDKRPIRKMIINENLLAAARPPGARI